LELIWNLGFVIWEFDHFVSDASRLTKSGIGNEKDGLGTKIHAVGQWVVDLIGP
jgi:hypothetical protein